MEEHLQQLALDVEMLNIIQTTRYLHPRPFVTKCGQLSLLMDYAANPELHGRFIDMVRISPAMFCALLSMIEQNPVFQNSSTNGQAPVEVQLAVMLYRMGQFGNANDVHDVARICGVSEGSEKEREKEWVDSKLGFRGLWREGYLMYDGTIVVLYQRPGQDGTSYFTRKSNYGLNAQIGNAPSSLRIAQRMMLLHLDTHVLQDTQTFCSVAMNLHGETQPTLSLNE
ncbi:hypothetical protein DFH05DRAFT_1549357 [Lentinula detonsa]|uniref:Uncharacterized protein n=1 Tax=Lentinula detonsa TaxID=2804962 RepID=A0A9W8P6K3_9AGAR|nr:hypothetical protein DFH05DRAFT_1549357 [Lentinula detonsa]